MKPIKFIFIGEIQMKRVILAVFLVTLTAGANAGCIRANMAGKWQTFIAEAGWGWSSCKISVGGSGKVTGGSCKDNLGTAAITGGQLTVNAACEVSGNLYVDGTLNRVTIARLSLDRSTLMGVVTIQGDSTTFSAMRY